jgi:hypothetical protein
MGFGTDAEVYVEIGLDPNKERLHIGTLIYDLDGVPLGWKATELMQYMTMEARSAGGIVHRAMVQIHEHDPADDPPQDSLSVQSEVSHD